MGPGQKRYKLKVMCAPWFSSRSHPDGRLLVELPDDSPLFHGHFPGFPVVPGIAFLAMVQAALPAARRLASFHRVRFRRLVQHGGRFAVTLAPARRGGESDLHFAVLRGEEPICGGRVHAPPWGEDPPALLPSPNGPPPAGMPEVVARIPHQGRMRLLQGVEAVEPGHCIGAARVHQDWPLVWRGSASIVTLVELSAQTASALIAWEERDAGGEGGKGVLVGLPTVSASRERIPVGTELRAVVRAGVRMDSYATFSGQVNTAAGEPLVELSLQAIRGVEPPTEA